MRFSNHVFRKVFVESAEVFFSCEVVDYGLFRYTFHCMLSIGHHILIHILQPKYLINANDWNLYVCCLVKGIIAAKLLERAFLKLSLNFLAYL